MIDRKKAIDANALLEAVRDDHSINGANFARFKRHIEAAPAVNPVHAAGGCYCWECKHYEKCTTLYGEDMVCTNQGYMRVAKRPDDFCSRGEKKEGEEDV